MKGWRYLEPRYADAMMTLGVFRIGTAQAFADLEDAQRDPLDSAVSQHLDYLHVADSNQEPANVALLAKVGIAVENCTNIRVVNARHVIAERRFHVLCLGDRPDNPHLMAENKTAVVEISDLEAFAYLAMAAFPQLGKCQIGPVRYGKNEFDIRGTCPPPDPFLKGDRFRAEGEIRMVWQMPTPPPSAVNVLIPQAIPLLTRRN